MKEKEAMWKITGAKECSKTEHFGVDAKRRGKRKQCSPERQKHSRAVHEQET